MKGFHGVWQKPKWWWRTDESRYFLTIRRPCLDFVTQRVMCTLIKGLSVQQNQKIIKMRTSTRKSINRFAEIANRYCCVQHSTYCRRYNSCSVDRINCIPWHINFSIGMYWCLASENKEHACKTQVKRLSISNMKSIRTATWLCATDTNIAFASTWNNSPIRGLSLSTSARSISYYQFHFYYLVFGLLWM